MIHEAWDSIDRALRDIPEARGELRPGATREEIRSAEERLGVTFPRDLTACYLRHDGQTAGVYFVFGPYRLWSLAQMVEQREALGRHDGDPDLLAFADNGGNTILLVDVGSGEGRGRIIDQCDGDRETAAPHLGALLARWSAELASGALVWDPVAGHFGTPEEIEQGAELVRREAWTREAMDSAPSVRELARLSEGTEVDLVGFRTGRVEGSRCRLLIAGGSVDLNGSLRGATFRQLLRVRIRVGRPRLLGLMDPVHEILGWERVVDPEADLEADPDAAAGEAEDPGA